MVLLCVRYNFTSATDLVKEEYSFGRGDTCDYCIETQHAGNKVPHFLTLSKTHFRVYRVRLLIAL